jgi:hypothetical protein
VLADSVQKRGKSIGDFVPFSKGSELHGMSDQQWGKIIEGIAEIVGLIGPSLSGEATLERLMKRFEYPFAGPTDVRMVMEYLSVNFGTGWQKLLMEEEGDIPSAYHALATLPIQSWLTTDYTDEFERALAAQGKKSRSVIPARFEPYPPNETVVFHMLGFVGIPASLTTDTPRTNALIDAIHLSQFHKLAAEGLVVFGFDRGDPEVAIIRRELGMTPHQPVPALTIAPPPDLANRRQLGRAQEYFQQYSRTRGVDYYWGTPEEFVEEFHRYLGPQE